jgi:hypothetical protein
MRLLWLFEFALRGAVGNDDAVPAFFTMIRAGEEPEILAHQYIDPALLPEIRSGTVL